MADFFTVKIKLQHSKLSVGAFKKELGQRLRERRDSFARRLLSFLFREVPVWSGAAQATLLPLSALIPNFIPPTIIPVVQVSDIKEGKITKGERVGEDRRKVWLETHGIEAGTRLGKGKTVNRKFFYTFTYMHGLNHFINLPSGGSRLRNPWSFLEEIQDLVEVDLANQDDSVLAGGLLNYFTHKERII